MKYSTDLSKVAEGDVVAVGRDIYDKWELKTVIRATKTQIIIKNFLGFEQKFNRATGYEITKTNFKDEMVVPHQRLLDEIAFKEVREEVYNKVVNKGFLNKLSIEQLKEISAMLGE